MKKISLILNKLVILCLFMGSPMASLAMVEETGSQESSSTTPPVEETDTPPVDEVPFSCSYRVLEQPEIRNPLRMDFGVPQFGSEEDEGSYPTGWRGASRLSTRFEALEEPLSGLVMGNLFTPNYLQTPEINLDEGGGNPWDMMRFSSFSPPPAKPMKRGGIDLPYVDPKKIGLVDYSKRYGVWIDQQWDLGSFFPKFQPFKLIDLDPSLSQPLQFSFEEEDHTLNERPFPYFCSDPQLQLVFLTDDDAEVLKGDLSDLKDEEIIERFKHLTKGIYIGDSTEKLRFLKELVRNTHAKSVILEASKATDDLLHKAWKIHSLCGDPEVLHVLLSQNEFVDHLSTLKNEEGEDILWSGLMTAILLNFEDKVAIYYKNPHLFACLVSKIKEEGLIRKIYLEAGLLMSLSSRDEKEVRELMNENVLRYLAHDESLLSSIVKNFTEDRNHALAKIFFEEHEFSLEPALLLAAIKVPTLWSHLSEETQSKLLKTVQSTFLDVDRETLEQEHRVLLASEHTLTSHPQTVEDMERFAPDLGQDYQKVWRREKSEEGRTVDVLKEKHRLEQEFLGRLQQEKGGKSQLAPWLAAESGYAYTQGVFGQGVKALVVELDELPEVQRERLLQDHLGLKTRYQNERKGSKALHNVGVTSLVSRMAPLTEVVSIRSSQLDALAQEISSREFPFINCSWGPTSALDEETSVSIFGSCKSLNDLLGQGSVVLIKSAGNEGLSLSHPDLKEDPCGIFFSKLLCRLSAEKLSNVILAVNLMPSNKVAESSNTPGYKDVIYRNTLSAQGSDTFWLDESGYDYRLLKQGGTSSAAPLITGAAALIKSKKPHFSPVQVKSCLMHSALREFERRNEEGVEWVYESEPQANSSLNQVPYRFEDYGMGILNVRSALIYADVLEKVLLQRQQQQVLEPLSFEDYEGLRKSLGNNREEKDVVLPLQRPVSSKNEMEKEVCE